MTTNPDRELLDKIAAEAEHAEETRDVELNYQRRRLAGGSRVYGLRLPVERIEQLRRVAQARGMDPSTLARQWVIAQLDEAEDSGTRPGNAGNATYAKLPSTCVAYSMNARRLRKATVSVVDPDRVDDGGAVRTRRTDHPTLGAPSGECG